MLLPWMLEDDQPCCHSTQNNYVKLKHHSILFYLLFSTFPWIFQMEPSPISMVSKKITTLPNLAH